VRKFFEQWAVYRKVVDQNYLHHREAYAAIEAALKELPGGFSFLELGAGDASFTSAILARCPCGCYEAVDLSETALNLAEKNCAGLAAGKKFTRADFFHYVPTLAGPFDAVFIGLSFHHLPADDKRAFFVQMRRLIKPGGFFMFYEPVMNRDEDRSGVMGRFEAYLNSWSAMTGDERIQIKKHVFENDYPESEQTFREMAAAAGFASTRVLYADSEQLYAAFQCA